MKPRSLPLMATLAALLTACGGSSGGKTALPESIGKPYEVMVVTSTNIWKSEVCDTIRHIFGEQVDMVNQPEPLYDLINVEHHKVNQVLSKHRNILDLKIDSLAYKTTTISARFDQRSQQQAIIEITSPRVDSAANYIWAQREVIIGIYDKLERDRLVSKATKFRSKEIGQAVKEQFGFDINIPSNYKIRNKAQDFMWISYELPLASLGFVIYTFEPAGENFNQLTERDIAVKKVPGPSDGSYMKSDTTFMPTFTRVTINDREWSEMRGFWNVKHDFMGGSFINFITQDPATGKMVGVDCYIYSPSPQFGQRTYLRQLEALVLTIKFDAPKS